MARTIALEVPQEVAAGAPVAVLHYTGKTVQLANVGTGTYQLQGSLDRTTWVAEGAALTADGLFNVSPRWVYLRWDVQAYTSGTPTSTLAGAYDGAAGPEAA